MERSVVERARKEKFGRKTEEADWQPFHEVNLSHSRGLPDCETYFDDHLHPMDSAGVENVAWRPYQGFGAVRNAERSPGLRFSGVIMMRGGSIFKPITIYL